MSRGTISLAARVALPMALAAASLACGPGESDRAPSCHGCNVVLVTFDALRADHLGVYGYPRDTSPRLDAFAGEARVFDSVLAQSGSTVNSLPSLFTSRYPFVDRIIALPELRLAEAETTLAEILRSRGYATGAVIGWPYAGSRFGLAQGFDVFDEDHGEDEAADRTVERAEALLARLEPPFLLWLHLRSPHTPYRVPDGEFERFYSQPGPTLQSAPPEQVLAHYATREPVSDYTFDGKPARLTASMVEQIAAQYDANIRLGDGAFGRLLDFLDHSGRSDDTVVVVASDHGESLGEHALVGHNDLYQGVLHTPLLLRVPGAGGGRSAAVAMNVDLLPTLLTLLGVRDSEPRRGRDLLAAQPGHEFQFAEYENARAVVVGSRYKLLIRRGARAGHELFDLAEDPDETRDLSKQSPRLLAQLHRLAVSLKPLDASAAAPLAESSESLEALRALGYIE